MKNDDEILKSLIEDGVVGTTLGELLWKNKGEGAALGAIAGAALLATYKAHERAMELNIPMYVEEKGSLYQIEEDGIKKMIRKINKPQTALPQNFKLK